MKNNLKEEQLKNTVNVLMRLLADTYIISVKTQSLHWNVTGQNFYAHHQMFEQQYKELLDAIDKIAERIRQLKFPVPASLAVFLQLTSLKEHAQLADTKTMCEHLLSDHESITAHIDQFLHVVKPCEDEVTLGLLIERQAEHDKISWMLRSTLGCSCQQR